MSKIIGTPSIGLQNVMQNFYGSGISRLKNFESLEFSDEVYLCCGCMLNSIHTEYCLNCDRLLDEPIKQPVPKPKEVLVVPPELPKSTKKTKYNPNQLDLF
jgi:hypothetical protein